MKKDSLHWLISIALIVVLVCSLTVTAFSVNWVEYLSGTQSVTVYGKTYTYYSQALAFTDGISFGTQVEVASSTPAGYIGMKARLYNAAGTLVRSCDWHYTQSPTPVIAGLLTGYDCTSGYYYSKGQVKFYNGNGYNTYTCYATPYLSPLNSKNSSAVSINDNGEIYGSEYWLNQIGIEPDLIEAMGENGVEGYIRKEDLEYDAIKTLEQVLQVTELAKQNRIIPLFAKDGMTVIGAFVVTNEDCNMTVY